MCLMICPRGHAQREPARIHGPVDNFRPPMSRVILAVAALLVFAPVAGAAVAPYGTNDAGGFTNVLPPGSAGVDNAFDLAAFSTAGTRPPHWDDQQPLYEG